MPAYVAFLRGINVGGNKTIPMAKLKAIFEALGFANTEDAAEQRQYRLRERRERTARS